MQHTPYRKYFEVILTVKMETKHPVAKAEGPFGNEFRRSVIIAEL